MNNPTTPEELKSLVRGREALKPQEEIEKLEEATMASKNPSAAKAFCEKYGEPYMACLQRAALAHLEQLKTGENLSIGKEYTLTQLHDGSLLLTPPNEMEG